MCSISAKDYLVWEKEQLSKGGDKQSLYYLLQCLGGISFEEINLLKLNTENKIFLKKNLEFIEFVWENHLINLVPIQYLCGVTFWRDLKLNISDKVLIPRSETELIVDIVLRKFHSKSEKLFFAELGTGSGAISIALALANPFWEGIATDIDKDALKIASDNFRILSSQMNLKFLCGNWWTPLENFKGELDLAISNPPYIPKETYKKLLILLI